MPSTATAAPGDTVPVPVPRAAGGEGRGLLGWAGSSQLCACQGWAEPCGQPGAGRRHPLRFVSSSARPRVLGELGLPGRVASPLRHVRAPGCLLSEQRPSLHPADPQLAGAVQDAESAPELAHGSQGLLLEVDTHVAGTVRALQDDMQRVLQRLSELETLTSAQVRARPCRELGVLAGGAVVPPRCRWSLSLPMQPGLAQVLRDLRLPSWPGRVEAVDAALSCPEVQAGSSRPRHPHCPGSWPSCSAEPCLGPVIPSPSRWGCGG